MTEVPALAAERATAHETVRAVVAFVSNYLSPMELLIPIIFALLCLWATFWLIRLAVRFGVRDALREHRQLTGRAEREQP